MTISELQPFLNLVGGACTLIAVAATLIVAGQRAQHDRERAALAKADEVSPLHAATNAQFLGLSRVVRERLSFAYLAAARPIEGFAAFDRWLNLAYSAPIALLVADQKLSVAFFTFLGEWERAYGSMIYSLDRLREQNLPTDERDSRQQDVIEASTAAAMIVDSIRSLLGDASEVADPKLPVSDLAPSVRRERGARAFKEAMRSADATPIPSLEEAKASPYDYAPLIRSGSSGAPNRRSM